MTLDDLGLLVGDVASLPAVRGGWAVPDWLKRPAVIGGICAALFGWFFGGLWGALALVVVAFIAVASFRDRVGI